MYLAEAVALGPCFICELNAYHCDVLFVLKHVRIFHGDLKGLDGLPYVI